MTDKTNDLQISFLFSYKNLRALYIAGNVLNAIVFVLPYLSYRGGTFGRPGNVVYSTLEICRLSLDNGILGWGLIMVLTFCGSVALAALAISYPRRWVFIAGSCYTAFWLMFDFFSVTDPNVQYIFLTRFLEKVAITLTLVGFWVKPPTSNAISQPSNH